VRRSFYVRPLSGQWEALVVCTILVPLNVPLGGSNQAARVCSRLPCTRRSPPV
jgi:hypothetical protein